MPTPPNKRAYTHRGLARAAQTYHPNTRIYECNCGVYHLTTNNGHTPAALGAPL